MPSPAEVRAWFSPAPELAYLDTATYGLPPRTTVEALEQALAHWRDGTAQWLEWEEDAEACRERFAELLSVSATEIALVSSLSVATATVLSGVPAGGEVLVAEGDFTSVLFPALVGDRQGAIRVREAPLGSLAEAVATKTRLVAVSHVHSATGDLVDVRAISEAARAVGAELYLDGTQALGVIPTDVGALGVDYYGCAAYKWLCSPRGVAALFVRRDLQDRLVPALASWKAADEPYSRYYGGPLTLAANARRFDVSLAWHAWVGARRSLELICSIADERRFELATEPVRRLADMLGLPAPRSSILSVPVADDAAAENALRLAGIRAARRAGAIRLSSHVYNAIQEAERAAEALAPLARRSP